MKLNAAGRIAESFLANVHLQYKNIVTRHYTVMPDHIHSIFEILRPDLCVGAIHESPLHTETNRVQNKVCYRDAKRKMLISKVVGWYKMNTAKSINKLEGRVGSAVWQRSYHDIVIDDKESYKKISGYIVSNHKRH